MMTTARRMIKSMIRSCGYDLSRVGGPQKPSDVERRMQLVRHFGITKLLDVGANAGQFAAAMRRFGFAGEIVSFEPSSEAYAKLAAAASNDLGWRTVKCALGSADGEATISIAANSFSSSLLGMLPAHLRAAPESAYVAHEQVTVRRLDSILGDYASQSDRILLKIDTQGYERQVIEGARNSLPRICGVQLEMSLVPLYAGELLLTDMIQLMREEGFELYSIENGFSDPASGRLLQVDGIFYASGCSQMLEGDPSAAPVQRA